VRIVGRRCSTGCSGSINGQSAAGVRTVRAPRGPSAGVSRTVRPCRVRVGPKPRDEIKSAPFPSPTPNPVLPSLSFLLPPKEKGSLLGILIGALPGPSEHIPGLSARFSTMSSRYFFRISHSISRILSKKVIRFWRCDLKFVHDFKILAW
jgi:hypothetical protein